jgi:uncharacterized glyoxalase superfamily protein PhnB
MIIPALRYDDAKAAIDFLERAFGFHRKEVHENGDGSVLHAELTSGRGMVMIGSTGQGDKQFDTGRALLYVIVADPDALCDMDYGSREFSARDPEGNAWSFGTYDPFAG